MNWNILQRWKFFHFWWKIFHFGEIFFLHLYLIFAKFHPKWKKWKIFHFGGKFPTSKKFPKKKIIPKSHELEDSADGGKISALAKFCFRVLDLSVCQIWAQICKVKIFPLWWKIFHFQKVAKKIFYSKITWIGSFCIEKFFRKIGNFSTFSTKSKIPKISLSGPWTVQSFSKKYFLKKVAPKQGDFEQKISNFQT